MAAFLVIGTEQQDAYRVHSSCLPPPHLEKQGPLPKLRFPQLTPQRQHSSPHIPLRIFCISASHLHTYTPFLVKNIEVVPDKQRFGREAEN